MKRRDFLWSAAAAVSLPPDPLVVPLRRVLDRRAKPSPDGLSRFYQIIWREAVRDFARCGIQFQLTDAPGEIRLSAGDRPIFSGVERGVLNLVLTDHIPMSWDGARALAGVTTIYDGYHLCVIALRYAHPHQIPFVSLNTCVHELLHAFLEDIFVSRPKWYQTGGREFRTDSYATGLWLFHDGASIRKSAEVYLGRLHSASGV